MCPESGLTNVQAGHLATISAAQHVCSVNMQCHCMPVSLQRTTASLCDASFSELASRTHLERRSGMSARHNTSCTVSAVVGLVRFMSRALRLS